MAKLNPKEATSLLRPGAHGPLSAADAVTVTATARLHFGFLDPSGRGTHPFGSFGLSLDRPRTRLTLRLAASFDASGPESPRALRYLRAIAESYGVSRAYAIEIAEAIAPHAGLGSGTQLALAVGSAFAALERLSLPPQQMAARLGRGARSGIGIGTFAAGGAVLDSGPAQGQLPRLVRRIPFPPEWRVLLMLDPDHEGLAGANEISAFETLPDFPDSAASQLREWIVGRALPALEARDFDNFCAEVGALQERMGVYFAPLQGGAYTSPRVAEILDWLRGQGVTGLGQSSWGPTGFAFARSPQEGEALLGAARRQAHAGLTLELARGRNEGAVIEAVSQKSR
ncbi:MAG: GHMP kinase [Methyloceanibacter sp.]